MKTRISGQNDNFTADWLVAAASALAIATGPPHELPRIGLNSALFSVKAARVELPEIDWQAALFSAGAAPDRLQQPG